VNDDDNHALLARIDERLKHVEKMVEIFVTQMEFAPVKMITFGLAGIALAAVVAAIVAQVIK
jgi:hypothetical protein